MNTTMNIARLLVVCKKIEGRKKLQKIVHILQSCGHGGDFPHQFGYLHYGPYSHDVKADIDRLVQDSNGLVDETPGVAGVSFPTFVYSPKPELEAAFSSSEPALWASLALVLNKKSPQDLEAISTIIFLRRSGVAESSLKERFYQLKPMLIEQFIAAQSFTDTLPMAKQS